MYLICNITESPDNCICELPYNPASFFTLLVDSSSIKNDCIVRGFCVFFEDVDGKLFHSASAGTFLSIDLDFDQKDPHIKKIIRSYKLGLLI